jgi:hypothetical protein
VTGYGLGVPSNLDTATRIREQRPGRYDVTIDSGWSIGDRPNGGYLMALVTRAAVAASPHPDPLTISAQFLRPPSFGPAVVEIDDLRIGRSVGFHTARLIENGETVLEARVTTGRLPSDQPDDGRSWQADTAPELPPPDSCAPAPANAPDGTHISLYEAVEVRYDRATVQWARPKLAHLAHEPVLRAWVRLADGPTDPYGVIVAADALPPAVFALGFRGWSPTVDMTTYLRGRPAPGWLRVVVHTQLVAGGWFDEQAVVWDANGQLVAQARQLALIGRAGRETARADTNDR